MIQGVGSSGGYDSSVLVAKIFKQVDTNSDGGIEASELQALNGDGSGLDFGTLLADLDSDSSGSIDTTEMESALQKIGIGTRSHIFHGGRPPMPPPDSAEMFTRADTDGSGGIDTTEFAAMGPGDIDEQMLDEMFSSLDTDGNGVIDATENEVALNRGGPPPPPPQSSSASVDGDETDAMTTAAVASSSATTLQQLLDALKSSDSTGADEDRETMFKIKRLIGELQAGTVYGKQGNLSVSSSGARNIFSVTA